MSLRNYLFWLFVGTLLALGVFLAILFNTDPQQADFLTKSAFFISLFLFLMGFLTFLGFYLRVYFSNREIIYANLPIALRQAGLISFLLVGIIVLQALRVLTVWSAVILILMVVLMEMYFRTKPVK